MTPRVPGALFTLAFLLTACGNPGSEAGNFSLLTYNIAGLPAVLTGLNPEEDIPQISPLLNSYDLVLVQEDFWYHDLLTADLTHPHRSKPKVAEPSESNLGDGLNRFSRMRFDPVERITWQQCSGIVDCSNDCMTDKGFSVARVYLSKKVSLTVYNLHMDAGDCETDFEAREAQRQQLVADLAARSPGEAVIVAGDTNLKGWKRPQDEVILDQLLSDTGLAVSCRTLSCPTEIHDRIMYRSSSQLTLIPTTWSQPAEFVDSEGYDLSDHKPVRVDFSWEQP
jgi:endonuclease/exonuclease/phosphatase family metal-dependent hydrolase